MLQEGEWYKLRLEKQKGTGNAGFISLVKSWILRETKGFKHNG